MLIKLAQLGGLVSDLINRINDWLYSTVIGALFTFIYQILVAPVLVVIDLLEKLFRKFAGLGTYQDNSISQSVDGDFVYTIITSEAIKNVFWSMIILAVVLLIICTFIAVIKSEFTPFNDKNGGNNKWKIITTAIKSLVNMAVVPICALVGIMIGNALLRALDGATSNTPSSGVASANSSISSRLFVTSAYSCNRVRRTINLIESSPDDSTITSSLDYNFSDNFSKEKFDRAFSSLSDKQKAELANMIDTMFQVGDSVSYTNAVNVTYYYNVAYFNFIIFAAAGIAITTFMIMIVIGLVKRIFSLATLFIIAPPVLSITPIYSDSLKNWNKSFIKQTLSAYSSIVCMNLFLIIIRALNNFSLFTSKDFPFVDAISLEFFNQLVYIFITIAGLSFVKDLTKDIASIIGSESAFDVGSSAAKDVASKAAMVTGAVTTGGLLAGKAMNTISAGAKTALNVASVGVAKAGGLGTKMSATVKNNLAANKNSKLANKILDVQSQMVKPGLSQEERETLLNKKAKYQEKWANNAKNSIQREINTNKKLEEYKEKESNAKSKLKESKSTLKSSISNTLNGYKHFGKMGVNASLGTDVIESSQDSYKKYTKEGGLFKPAHEAGKKRTAKETEDARTQRIIDEINNISKNQTLNNSANNTNQKRSAAAKKGWVTRRANSKTNSNISNNINTIITKDGKLTQVSKQEYQKRAHKLSTKPKNR